MTLMKSVTLATALMAAVSSPVLAAPIAPAAVPQDSQVQ